MYYVVNRTCGLGHACSGLMNVKYIVDCTCGLGCTNSQLKSIVKLGEKEIPPGLLRSEGVLLMYSSF